MTYRPKGLRARIIDALWRLTGGRHAEPFEYDEPLPTVAEQALQRAATDLAEQYDMPVEDAVAKLRSGLTAYAEPLRFTSEGCVCCRETCGGKCSPECPNTYTCFAC